MTIRAMFRLMTVSHHADATPSHRYLAVTGRVKHATPEHKSFWRYTPSGEIEVTLAEGQEPGVAGTYFYVNMKEDAQGAWKLVEVSQQEGSLTVKFRLPWGLDEVVFLHGTMSITICNEAVWDRFVGKVGSRWGVGFIRAEAPADDED